ncbi:hypothetical protein DDZ14_07115 [Maritimibacter sp. 55A14]|uniref:DUF502 domain-containing protein n=1 Tax=Maritimibacter sp. 55A14 TaxID=2174844 RepID=UPI000D60ED8A|nr:DUF502 domain-containing protein [Maritimibacter sp. 55A14]PWE33170.1 hypothetical protein DDZ14_07115 [Maritimibacter sp. 55A14]
MKNEDAENGARRHRPGRLAALRANFLTGLIIVAPVALTLYLVWWTIGAIDAWVLPFVPKKYQPSTYIGVDVRGVGVVIFFVFTMLVGWMAKGLIGRSLIHWGERIVDRMPIVRTLYNGFKQIAETVLSQTESNFEKACLVEYPRRGIWCIAFVSTSAKGEIKGSIHVDDEMLSVFLPTTPNPTSGFLLFVPKRDVIFLEMGVEDAAKLVISAGLVYPNPKDPTRPAIPANRPTAAE